MKPIVVLSTIALLGVLLAGCASEAPAADSDDPVVDRETFQLQEGKGAIAGLLVDDRFRPIHLTDDPQSEFQTTGFILLQETGKEVKTNENGEFTFTNLEPGQYTLRVTAAGHEATPQRVTVTDGVFNEASIVARRTISDDGFILVQEYGIFIICGIDAVVIGLVGSTCMPDSSGDSNRFSFTTDYRPYNDTVSYVVSEVSINQEGDYTLVIRKPGDTAFGGDYYVEAHIRDTDYFKVIQEYGEVNTEHDQRGNVAWMNDSPMNNILFYDGMFKDDLYGIYDGEATCVPDQGLVSDRTCRGFSGVGARFGMQATFMQSLFFGEAEVDVESYCVLCPGAQPDW